MTPNTQRKELSAIYDARYKQAHPDRIAETRRSWRHRNKEKHSAHFKVYKAISQGLLTRPTVCSKCGASGKIESSHDDYSKPLEVEWLCVSCHRRKDAEGRRAFPRQPRTKFFDSEGRLQCTGCEAWLETVNFHRNKSRPSGYQNYCKECFREYKYTKRKDL